MTTPDTNPGPSTSTSSRRVRANGDGTVYQRKDGRWEAAGYVLAPGGTRKRVRVYGPTRKDALAKLTEKIAASNRGIPAVFAQDSLAAYLTYWLENVAVHHLRETTHTRYTACVQQYIIPGLGKKKLAKLTAKDIRTWLNELRTVCQCCAHGIDAGRNPNAQPSRRPRCCAIGKCCGKRLSPLTLAYIHSVLKSALEHAVREEEISRNVARNVRTGTPRPRRFNPLTTDEARRFLAAARGHRLAALFELALRTGLRKGELLGLRWEDLDLDGGTASIRRTLQRTASRGLATLPTKTISSERRIALPASCVASLRGHRERQAREEDQAGPGWQGSSHVFARPDGHPIEPATLTRHFNLLLRDAHLRPIRFHDLRHSTATLLLEQGVELVVIKELLGHAHIGVTATVYAHVRLRLQRQAIDLLGHALGDRAEGDDGDDPPPCAAPVR
ncbi:site-specific integrase [Streptomyces sp. MUM 16J]|uniref:tyrosine-type recombinase/integrase n=1 Tax=Streptomyces sp. MUM 16J TaxID=2791988 RepID=UPI001F036249|nr:site-specific integrase [Streptomyces sp. MUM 16J]MCH0560273.1 site-specific integrase [Streptomyces sp. MUM 16J]